MPRCRRFTPHLPLLLQDLPPCLLLVDDDLQGSPLLLNAGLLQGNLVLQLLLPVPEGVQLGGPCFDPDLELSVLTLNRTV